MQDTASRTRGCNDDLVLRVSFAFSVHIDVELTGHMVASVVLFDPHTTSLSGTLLRRVLDLLGTRVVFDFAFAALAPVVFVACLAHVHRLFMCGTNEKRAGYAAEYVALDAGIVDLARVAAGAQAVAEVRDRGEEGAGRQFIVPML